MISVQPTIQWQVKMWQLRNWVGHFKMWRMQNERTESLYLWNSSITKTYAVTAYCTYQLYLNYILCLLYYFHPNYSRTPLWQTFIVYMCGPMWCTTVIDGIRYNIPRILLAKFCRFAKCIIMRFYCTYCACRLHPKYLLWLPHV